MATSEDLRRIALSLAGTQEVAHMNRTAFKVARIYATLAPDGLTANLKLEPEEQEFRCMMAPETYSPVPGGWGAQGWTTVALDSLAADQLKSAVEAAWRNAQPRKRSSVKKSPR